MEKETEEESITMEPTTIPTKELPATPTPKKKEGKLKVILLFLVVVVIALGAGYTVATLGFIEGLVPTKICNETANQSLYEGLDLGYSKGIYDSSQLVLKNNTLAMFVNNSGEIKIQYLNLAEYYWRSFNGTA